MRKRAKLTQEQLKAVMQGWKTLLLACHAWDIGDYFSDEHVYTQIEELIEDSDTAAWMDRCHELEMDIAKLREGLTVTREKFDRICDSMRCADILTSESTYGDVARFVIGQFGITVETTH